MEPEQHGLQKMMSIAVIRLSITKSIDNNPPQIVKGNHILVLSHNKSEEMTGMSRVCVMASPTRLAQLEYICANLP